MSSADAVVIGAGPNGLFAANRLADAGREVVVCEAAPELRRTGTVPVSDGIGPSDGDDGPAGGGRIPYRPFLIMGQDAMSDPTREAESRMAAPR